MRREYDFSRGKSGPVVAGGPGYKVRISIRLDEGVVRWFKERVHEAGGGNYQTLINTALKEYIERSEEPLEGPRRKSVREDVQDAGQSETAGR